MSTTPEHPVWLDGMIADLEQSIEVDTIRLDLARQLRSTYTAVRHGRGRIVVTVVGDADRGAHIDVGDQGPTPPVDVFSDTAADTGHGIGLRLARTLAESIGGVLELLDRPTPAPAKPAPRPKKTSKPSKTAVDETYRCEQCGETRPSKRSLGQHRRHCRAKDGAA